MGRLPGPGFFLPVRVLSRLFRRLFLDELRAAFEAGELGFFGDLAGLAEPTTFTRRLRELRRVEWVVYAKPPFGGPAQVLAYLGRYTDRVAITNSRLINTTGAGVVFRCKDYRHHGKSKIMTLSANEFIRRFLLHTLPDGFHRIRHYGFLANGHRAAKLALPIAARRPAASFNPASMRSRCYGHHFPSNGATSQKPPDSLVWGNVILASGWGQEASKHGTTLFGRLRRRVVGAVDGGMSPRRAAALFRVAISTVNHWVRRWLETGSIAAKPMGGDHSSRLTGERTWLLERIAAVPDLTLEEIRQELAERGIVVGYGTDWRFFTREGISFKKTVHVAEQERPDVAQARAVWQSEQTFLDPALLVFSMNRDLDSDGPPLRARQARPAGDRSRPLGPLENRDLRCRLPA